MQTIRQTRHENFLRLFDEFKGMIRSVEPDARDQGMLLRFATVIDPDTPKKQADYLSQMKNDRYAMSTALARRLEDALAKPVGWMDVIHGDELPETPTEARVVAALLRLYRHDPSIINHILVDHVLAESDAQKDEQKKE